MSRVRHSEIIKRPVLDGLGRKGLIYDVDLGPDNSLVPIYKTADNFSFSSNYFINFFF